MSASPEALLAASGGWRARLARLGAGQADFLAVLLARVLQLGNAFAVSVVLVWVHGLEAAGAYALAALPAAAAGHLCSLGLANSLPRQALEDGQRATIAVTSGLVVLPALLLPCALYGWLMGRNATDAAVITLFAWSGGIIGQMGVQQTLQVLQGRTRFAPVTPLLHLLGIGLAAAAHSLLMFALVLAATRLVGSLAGFAVLRFRRVGWQQQRAAVAEGVRFMPLDLIAMASEMVPIPLLALGLTRAEIGLYGLARQFLVAADTPGWSFVQTRYPAMVQHLATQGAAIAHRNEHLSWLAAAGAFVSASAMALLVYRLPQLVMLLPVMLLPLPTRYIASFADLALRAEGHVRESLRLGLTKLAASLVLFPLLAWVGGLWGAVTAFALVSILAGLLYRRRLLQHHPGLLRPLRPWRFA